jgi:hypothetical protein
MSWLRGFLGAVLLCLLASCDEEPSSDPGDAALVDDGGVPSPKPGSRCDELGFWWDHELDKWAVAREPCTTDEDCVLVPIDVTCALPDGSSLQLNPDCDGSVSGRDKQAYEAFRSELAENLCELESLPSCYGAGECFGDAKPFCGNGRCQGGGHR